jgi:hypothetical protein
MKNVIYINCFADPWIQVAKRLQEEYEFKPVWWIGYSKEDNSDVLVPQAFPDIVYQDNVDAWKGRFSKEIQDKAETCYLDVDFLRRHANHELQAIKMMDRMDQDLRSFNFMERQRHFRNMIKQWMAVVEIIKPDLVISTAIPHRLYDYVLYWLCEERNIPFLTIQHTQFPGRFYFSKNEFYTIKDLFVEDWHKLEEESNIEQNIPTDIKTRFEKVALDYKQGAPVFMEKMNKREDQVKSPLFLIKQLIRKYTKVYGPYLLGQPAGATIIWHCAYDKKANRKYEESEGNIYQHERTVIKARRYKKQLKKAYESLTTPPNFNEKYVSFFLHYQPEATSCPGGDIFVDQRLCIEMLLKNLPSEYKIYIKEHPHQFSNLKIGHTGRMRDLYDDLVKNERVKLISTKVNSFDLISNAQAVSTITGTAGWEAMVRHKPVIVFGLCWYENYSKGVLRITDENSAKNMQHFIESYKYDDHSIKAYLASVGKHTYCSDYFKLNKKDILQLTEEESVNNVINAIVDCLEDKN